MPECKPFIMTSCPSISRVLHVRANGNVRNHSSKFYTCLAKRSTFFLFAFILKTNARAWLLFSNILISKLSLPSKLAIFKLVQKFLHTGNIQDALCSGRPCMMTTAEVQQELREIIKRHVYCGV